MIIDTDEIKRLLKSDWTGYKISQITNIYQVTYDRYKNGTSTFENMPLKTAMELSNVAKLTFPEQYQIVIKIDGKLDMVKNFDSFTNLKLDLMTIDYFGWLREMDPDVIIPEFGFIHNMDEINELIEPFQSDLWSFEVNDYTYKNTTLD